MSISVRDKVEARVAVHNEAAAQLGLTKTSRTIKASKWSGIEAAQVAAKVWALGQTRPLLTPLEEIIMCDDVDGSMTDSVLAEIRTNVEFRQLLLDFFRGTSGVRDCDPQKDLDNLVARYEIMQRAKKQIADFALHGGLW